MLSGNEFIEKQSLLKATSTEKFKDLKSEMLMNKPIIITIYDPSGNIIKPQLRRLHKFNLKKKSDNSTRNNQLINYTIDNNIVDNDIIGNDINYIID